jgi:hypothetical protein
MQGEQDIMHYSKFELRRLRPAGWSLQETRETLSPGMAIPHYAAIFFAGSRSASRGGQLRNDLDPTLRRRPASDKTQSRKRMSRPARCFLGTFVSPAVNALGK